MTFLKFYNQEENLTFSEELHSRVDSILNCIVLGSIHQRILSDSEQMLQVSCLISRAGEEEW